VAAASITSTPFLKLNLSPHLSGDIALFEGTEKFSWGIDLIAVAIL
jgi:hypothetical protein